MVGADLDIFGGKWTLSWNSFAAFNYWLTGADHLKQSHDVLSSRINP